MIWSLAISFLGKKRKKEKKNSNQTVSTLISRAQIWVEGWSDKLILDSKITLISKIYFIQVNGLNEVKFTIYKIAKF